MHVSRGGARHPLGCQVILVTSAVPEEGKSTISALLAKAYADDPLGSALVIDCDLRRATLHKQFSKPPSPGLADALFGRVSLTDAIQTIGDRVDYIAAGRISSDPARLLDSKLFTKYLEVLRNHYRTIILDAPPLLLCPEPSMFELLSCLCCLWKRFGLTNYAHDFKLFHLMSCSEFLC